MKFPAALLFASLCLAQSGDAVLLVVNSSSTLSRRTADYYIAKRSVPLANVAHLKLPLEEEIVWETYSAQIERPIGDFLRGGNLQEKILYILLMPDVPLKVSGKGPRAGTEACSVDSELALLYAKMRGAKFGRAGTVPNPFFSQRDAPFRHPQFPIYLVTRLAGYAWEDVKGLIDRSVAAANRGKFIFDMRSGSEEGGDGWLKLAGILLPEDRVTMERSSTVLYDRQDVIGYASWGSNDKHRKKRMIGFKWLPGAIVTEYVSTNGRTFRQPPADWSISIERNDFAGSTQSLTADYIREGATGVSGHVYEPFLGFCPRPEYLFPAYFRGRTLAESYYMAIPALSWMNIVVGDPLCRIGKVGQVQSHSVKR